MNASICDSAVIPPPRWWLAAPSFLAAAYVVVLLAVVAVHSGGSWIGGPPSIVVPATAFQVVRGSGQLRGAAFVLDSLDAAGNAVVTMQVAPFAAAEYSRVEWTLAAPSVAQPVVAFLWRTREHPNRMQSKTARWIDGRIAPLDLDAKDGWTGTVAGVALAVRGILPEPLALESVTLPGTSAATAANEIRRQWIARHPFKASSIAFPFDEERDDRLSLLATTALAQALALACYLLVARRRRWPFDARVAWAVFLAGWFVLDARWQVGLWRQLRDTGGTYAGKTTEEKHLATAERDFYAMMNEVGAALPAPPARVFFLSDNASLRARGAFFLYPHNVNAFYLDLPPAARAREPDTLRPGDCLLLLLYSGARYEREAGALVWRDGRRRQVDELLWKTDGIFLLRVK